MLCLQGSFLRRSQSAKQLMDSKASERLIAEAESHLFPSLFVAQSLKYDEIMPRSAGVFQVCPYDMYCPSLQTCLLKNLQSLPPVLCLNNNVEKAYRTAQRSGENDTSDGSRGTSNETYPSNEIAARRQRELMAIIARKEHAHSEDAEWIDEDELDLSGIVLPGNEAENVMPVVTMEEHFSSP